MNETDRLARALAAATGESITEATRKAIRERLDRLGRQAASGAGGELAKIIERGRARAILDSRPAEDILGYNGSGLPE